MNNKTNQQLTTIEQSDLLFECIMDLDNITTLNDSVFKFMECDFTECDEENGVFGAFLGAKLEHIRNLNNMQRDYIEKLNNSLNKLEGSIDILLKEERERGE